MSVMMIILLLLIVLWAASGYLGYVISSSVDYYQIDGANPFANGDFDISYVIAVLVACILGLGIWESVLKDLKTQHRGRKRLFRKWWHPNIIFSPGQAREKLRKIQEWEQEAPEQTALSREVYL